MRAKDVLGMVNESNEKTKEDIRMSVVALQSMLGSLRSRDGFAEDRMHVEMGLDGAGLLDGKEGKQYYKADNLLDKAVKEFEILLKQLKAK